MEGNGSWTPKYYVVKVTKNIVQTDKVYILIPKYMKIISFCKQDGFHSTKQILC